MSPTVVGWALVCSPLRSGAGLSVFFSSFLAWVLCVYGRIFCADTGQICFSPPSAPTFRLLILKDTRRVLLTARLIFSDETPL